MKRLIYILLGLLGVGVSGCDDGSDGGWDGGGVAEYGVPHIQFRLSARVVDSEGNPIQGIVASPEGDSFDSQTGVSDYLGLIDASGSCWPGSQNVVEFVDIDGELNGGEFETLRLDISDKVQQTHEGEGAWYDGDYEVSLGDVVMTRKDSNDVD